MSAQKHGFQTEVAKLLDLLANSLYSNKEVFLRELISNASDAIEKLHFLALTDADLIKDDPNFAIHVKADAATKTLTITDNGIGMTTEQIEQLLNPEESPKNRRGLNGIGISNINQRIKMTYGQEYGISITSKPGAYTDVLICIPYERSTSL